MSCELSYRYWNPCRWKKLATWWPDCDPMDCSLPGSSMGKSMGFSRQEYWSGLLFSSPGDLPNPGIEPGSPALQTGALLSEPPGKPVAMTSCYNSENWLRRNGNRLTLELKAILKTVKMTLIRPLMTNFSMTIRADCEVSACSPLPSSWKALAYWLVGVESAFGWKFPSRLQALEIEQTLLSTNFASLALEPQAPEPTFANRFWRPREAVLSRCLAEGGGTKWSCRHDDTPGGLWGTAVRGSLALRGALGVVPSSCQTHLFWGSSLLLPCSALSASLCFSLVKRTDASGQGDEVQDTVNPPVCVRLTSLLRVKYYLGIFANWFWRVPAVKDPLWALSVIWVSLLAGSDVYLTSRPISVGNCLFGTPYPLGCCCC